MAPTQEKHDGKNCSDTAPTGRLGLTPPLAFETAGWEVHDLIAPKTLWDAAWGASVIVNGWNPPYPQWAARVPDQTAEVIEVAKASSAAVIIPGNVYVFGAQGPERFRSLTHRISRPTPADRIRIFI
jgi:hypothetical protein